MTSLKILEDFCDLSERYLSWDCLRSVFVFWNAIFDPKNFVVFFGFTVHRDLVGTYFQCCGSGSAWIRNFLSDPDPELEVSDPDPGQSPKLDRKML
jgi:hypothetical protein